MSRGLIWAKYDGLATFNVAIPSFLDACHQVKLSRILIGCSRAAFHGPFSRPKIECHRPDAVPLPRLSPACLSAIDLLKQKLQSRVFLSRRQRLLGGAHRVSVWLPPHAASRDAGHPDGAFSVSSRSLPTAMSPRTPFQPAFAAAPPPPPPSPIFTHYTGGAPPSLSPVPDAPLAPAPSVACFRRRRPAHTPAAPVAVPEPERRTREEWMPEADGRQGGGVVFYLTLADRIWY